MDPLKQGKIDHVAMVLPWQPLIKLQHPIWSTMEWFCWIFSKDCWFPRFLGGLPVGNPSLRDRGQWTMLNSGVGPCTINRFRRFCRLHKNVIAENACENTLGPFSFSVVYSEIINWLIIFLLHHGTNWQFCPILWWWSSWKQLVGWLVTILYSHDQTGMGAQCPRWDYQWSKW